MPEEIRRSPVQMMVSKVKSTFALVAMCWMRCLLVWAVVEADHWWSAR